ncbi:MAG: hypothetical protein Rhob2KO_23190 [Rhodopirellula baltica]
MKIPIATPSELRAMKSEIKHPHPVNMNTKAFIGGRSCCGDSDIDRFVFGLLGSNRMITLPRLG